MKDSTKIAVLGVYAGAATVTMAGMGYLIVEFTRQYQKDTKKKLLASLVIRKFVEYSDVEVCQRVVEETQFDLITAGLDIKEP